MIRRLISFRITEIRHIQIITFWITLIGGLILGFMILKDL